MTQSISKGSKMKKTWLKLSTVGREQASDIQAKIAPATQPYGERNDINHD